MVEGGQMIRLMRKWMEILVSFLLGKGNLRPLRGNYWMKCYYGLGGIEMRPSHGEV